MTGVPRRNERRFYRYPMGRMVAIISDEPHLNAVLTELRQAGVDPAGINVLSGPEGARLLDRSGTGHGPFARVLRWLQGGAYEVDALRIHEQALNDGKHIIYVPVRGDDQRRKVADILRAAGGRYLLYFRRWSVEQLPA